jgi:hypothetical protein
MEKKTAEAGGPPYALTEVNFLVTCDDPKFKFQGTDIEELRYAAWDKLDDKYKINWENYYLVQVQPERIYEGLGSGLSMSYKHVYKGTTWDGKELMKESAWRGEPKISAWPGRFTDNAGRAIACIPDTKENTRALEEFAKRIDTLRGLIRDTLKPEMIMQTLQNLSGLALLPPPGHDEDNTDKEVKRRKAR